MGALLCRLGRLGDRRRSRPAALPGGALLPLPGPRLRPRGGDGASGARPAALGRGAGGGTGRLEARGERSGPANGYEHYFLSINRKREKSWNYCYVQTTFLIHSCNNSFTNGIWNKSGLVRTTALFLLYFGYLFWFVI